MACHCNRGGSKRAAIAGKCYKGHLIDVSVSLDGGDWHTRIFIYYSDGPQNMLVTFAMDDSFKTYDGAIKAGLAAAQKWVDGKMRDT